MHIEQFVMAYGVEQDRLRALLPEGFQSLRPVLRINAEIQNEEKGYLELNTAVEKEGKKGWLNIGCWSGIPFRREGRKVIFETEFLQISFLPVGIEGNCPAEKDNEGCFFTEPAEYLRPPEEIKVKKEFCDCEFRWSFAESDARGKSTGQTLPAFPTEIRRVYPKKECTAANAAAIPCQQVLGTYTVCFERE